MCNFQVFFHGIISKSFKRDVHKTIFNHIEEGYVPKKIKKYNRSKTQNDFSFDLEEIAEYKFYSNEWFC